MKKILLTIFLFLICSTAHATTWYACQANGNWSSTTAWTSVSADQVTCAASLGTPVAGDTAVLNGSSGNITITTAASAAFLDETGYAGTLAFGTQTLTLTTGANLGGAMTSTSGTITNSGGTITLLSTPTGTFPTLSCVATQTLTSGGYTWPGALKFNTATQTDTLVGNWINTGLVTTSSAVTLNKTTSETFTSNGGLTVSTTMGGTSSIILGGGAWIGGTVDIPITISGNITLRDNIVVGAGGGVIYSSGTVTTTGSYLYITGNSTFNTSGMTWANVLLESTSTITLQSNFIVGGTLANYTGNSTFVGAYNISCAYFTNYTGNGSLAVTIPSGQTLTVTTGMLLSSAYQFESTIGTLNTFTLKSGTSNSPAYFDYLGTQNNAVLASVNFTDINASGSTNPIYDMGESTLAPTLTRTVNIISATTANFGGQGYTYGG